MRILGIDPGLTGGFAFLSDEGLRAGPLPVTKIVRNRKDRTELDATAFFELLGAERPDFLLIENVSGIKGQAAGGSFVFGDTCGALRGVWHAYASYRRLDPGHFKKILPIVWQARTGVKRESVTFNVDLKDASRRVASKLYPQVAHLFAPDGSDGIADATLIATYAHRFPQLL